MGVKWSLYSHLDRREGAFSLQSGGTTLDLTPDPHDSTYPKEALG